MKQATIIAVIGLLCMGSPSVWAESENPFGFETNTHPLEYGYCKRWEFKRDASRFWYQCSSAPRMHPDIDYIFLKFVEDVGPCRISAYSFRSSKKIEDRVDLFKDQIVQKYGHPTQKTEDESDYGYDWDPEAGYSGLGNIKAIQVKESYRDGANRVIVIFWLKADKACQEKIDEHRASAF